MSQITTILFGGCMVHPPLRAAPEWSVNFSTRKYGARMGIHNYAQILQVIQMQRGEKTVPAELLSYCNLASNTGPVIGSTTYADLDFALIEISTPIELAYRGCQLHAFGINHVLIPETLRRYPDLSESLKLWMQKGLQGQDEKQQLQYARAIMSGITGRDREDDLLRMIVKRTKSALIDTATSLKAIRDIFPCPIGIVLFHFKYLPDGRVLNWPPAFADEVSMAAKELSIPVFDPAPLIMEAGVENAIGSDGRHYSRQFELVMGKAITEFSLSITAQSGRAPKPAAVEEIREFEDLPEDA